MEYRKTTNLLDTTSDNIPRSISKKFQNFMISHVVLKIDTNRVNK